MNKSKVIKKVEEYTREKTDGEGSGHDWWHAVRVRNIALTLAEKEKANMFIVNIVALIHDLIDDKFDVSGRELRQLETFFEEIGLSPEDANTILGIAKNISFSKEIGKEKESKSIELQVVQDADRLDAIGAIGIARCFAYGGFHERLIFNPEEALKEYKTKEEYRNSNSSSLNHFFEKLLKLKDFMNTKSGMRIAQSRHKYMKKYTERFLKEWKGEL